MLQIDSHLHVEQLQSVVEKLFEISGPKIVKLNQRWRTSNGAPVFTKEGQYTSRSWTEWTLGFQFGSALIQYEVTRDECFLDIGRRNTVDRMAAHLTHIGVHDHGFNEVCTYGNLLRLMHEKVIPYDPWEKNFYELAMKISGAVQASRWTALGAGQGYIYSFSGPHSLFSGTIRSLRSLAISDHLGHELLGESDQPINLLHRLLEHAETTARYNVYFGGGRDFYDVRGRVANESIFNLNDGSYRCPGTQQGFSPFSTWMQGLSWILCGFSEQLEFIATLPEDRLSGHGGKEDVLARFSEVAEATADFYIQNTPTDGIPYWDTGAPGLGRMGNYLDRASDPFNDYEPVDSSAAVVAAQGLLRLGNYLMGHDQPEKGRNYFQAGLTLSRNILSEPYLGVNANHEGLILHSIYHRPNGWDYIPVGSRIPFGESSMWGDYHARELALLLWREATGKPYLTFFNSFF